MRPGRARGSRWLRALVTVVLAGGVVAAAVATAGASPASHATSPRSASTETHGTTWAVIVGIDSSPGEQPLGYAAADAEEADRAIRAAGVPASHRLLLLNGAATAHAVEGALGWLVANAGSDDTAVIFFAGHGAWLSPTSQALVTADGGRLTAPRLAADLKPLAAKHAWIVLAACYAGGFSALRAPGRIIAAAADANHAAYENSALGHSYLAAYLFGRALHDNASRMTIQDAYAQAQRQLRRTHPDRMLVEYDDSSAPLTIAG